MPRVYVGIGSNIDRESNVRKGVAAIRGIFGKLNLSSVYESEAYGFKGDNFYNLIAGFETDMTVEVLADTLRGIEYKFGRRRHEQRFLSRTLDIDLLLYDDLVRHDEDFDLPREDILRYSFVLCPLAELAGDELHPELGKRYTDIWNDFDQGNQPLRQVNFIMSAD
jgi:2-amino-4-hydroxy-6-hydroxymethyldihydropteridine diphosphokinase